MAGARATKTTIVVGRPPGPQAHAATIEPRRAETQSGSAGADGAGERDPTIGRGPPKTRESSFTKYRSRCLAKRHFGLIAPSDEKETKLPAA